MIPDETGNASPKRVYRRTAPYQRDKATINKAGLRSRPSVDTVGDTTAFPLLKVSAELLQQWGTTLIACDRPHPFMARLAIHQVNHLPPDQITTKLRAYMAMQSKIVPAPRFTTRFPAFKISAKAMDDFNLLCAQCGCTVAHLARFALHRIPMMETEAVNQAIADYMANFKPASAD